MNIKQNELLMVEKVSTVIKKIGYRIWYDRGVVIIMKFNL